MPLPARVPFVIVGAGFAGAATAWALAREGLGPGLLLEQEAVYGFHASGRNAAMLYLVETDPLVLALALRSLGRLVEIDHEPERLIRPTGGLTLAAAAGEEAFRRHHGLFAQAGLATSLLGGAEARARFPISAPVTFDLALWCPSEGVVDIHGLLTWYLQRARDGGFALATNCRVEDLLFEAGRASGVATSRGEIRADLVVDASGAWAGRLGRGARPLPLQPKRRHLFVMGPATAVSLEEPFVWDEDASFYYRPEGDGMLFSPCDETDLPPGDPPLDPAASELLAEKLARKAPAFVDLPVRRSWACLRTFAPDRRPVIGFDPDLPGLFHVAGLGGFGMSCSAGVGDLAAALIAGRQPAWIDPAEVSPARFRGTRG
jgi:D-arginine dehydrogenase